MRVAFVVGQFPALSETFVLNQITGLLDRGVDVDVYSVARRPQSTMHPDVERYDLIRRTTYAEPEPDATRERRARVLRSMLLALRHAGVSPGRLRNVLRHGREDAGMALRFAPGTRRYDVIHCHFGPYGQWGAALRNMGILSGALVTAFHGYDMTRYLRAEGDNVYARLFREGDLFLPISRFWRDRLIELGCDGDRTRVHHMGVDCRDFAFVPRSLPDDGRLRLLTVGRLVEKKGVEYAIRAVARLSERIPRLHYTVIGDGPLRASLEGLIAELGLGDRVELAGPRHREEVVAAMGEAHVLLAPSVTDSRTGDQEGIPVVLMEAMAAGLPVLSTHHTGIPELVADGETGRLVQERHVDGIAATLAEMLEDRDGYARMARAARRRVEQEFDIAGLNDRLLEIFRGLAGTGTGPSAALYAPGKAPVRDAPRRATTSGVAP